MREEFYAQKVEITIGEFIAMHDALEMLNKIMSVLDGGIPDYKVTDAIKTILGRNEDKD